ncbi:MAG: alanine--tRNA ligase [Ruminococcaceae bacterium]|nr:alanine--tRNA ligase [Oscillospiraceae bacterium]
MEKYGVNEIREKFLSFFESKGCLRLGSFSLVPKNDASLLLINSGMAPMKKWFTGAEVPPKKRVTTCQKCIRTPDIECVGKTARHGTFFEMLGNFSFGDYFKREAISWGWEFLTEVMGIPADKLWITVYEEDDEARDIWINEIGVSPERVVKMGKKDNFWEHGTGPCGPCSEIHVDRGEEYSCGPDCKLGCECDRFMEVWNLVFTQFDKDEDGNYNRLANPNIDTGMGLERLAAIMQGVENLFEVDTVRNIMNHISKIAGVEYKKDAKTDVSLRVITDHIRSTVMMVSDGVIPSNEGRGYVLRRLLRRAARHGKLLNVAGEFLYTVADTVIDESKQGYPELAEKREYIKKIIRIEEERFAKTIDNGLAILNEYIAEVKANGESVLSGEKSFKLNDTYGFPIDLTVEICQEAGITVDRDGYDKELKIQKETARSARKDGSSWEDSESYVFEDAKETEFAGYDSLELDSVICGIAKAGEISNEISQGEAGIIVTNQTPFYAEMGGQAGDIGVITADGKKATVTDTKKNGNGIYMHIVEVEEGTFTSGDKVTLSVCKKNRMAISRNHSATHLLHKALKEVLGDHVAQAGSEVNAKHLRFDFSHFEAMTKEELALAEAKVNDAVLSAMDINVQELPIEEAKKLGAEAQFGEKYGDVVRVVKMGDYSIEFCGGTHLTNTANVGLFKLISESGVAAGTRRIEAVTGQGVLDYIKAKDILIENTAVALKSNNINEIDKKAEQLSGEVKELKKKLESLNAKMASGKVDDVLSGKVEIGGITVVAGRVDGLGGNDLRNLGDSLKEKIGTGIAVLASCADDKIAFLATATPDAVKMGVHAGMVIKEITKIAGGSGGGKPDMAQGGGKDASKIEEALGTVCKVVESQLK